MSARAGYSPVIDVARRPQKKKLAQGSLTSLSSDLLLPPSNKVTEICKKTDATAAPRMRPKVVYHSPVVHHNQIGNCALTEKIIVDSPTTAFITAGATSSDSLNPVISSSRKNTSAQCVGNEKQVDVEGSDALHSCGSKTSANVPVQSIEITKTPVTKETLPKKKQIKAVASRYKQQLDRTKIESSSAKPSKSKLNKTKISRPVKPTFHESDKVSKVDSNSHEGKTSTPSSRFKTFFESDMSAIQLAPADKKGKMPFGGKKESVSSASLNVAYAQYLCGAYMKAAMQKSSQMRQKNAVNDLIKLCQANVKLYHEVTDLENEVKSLKFERDLELQVDDQIEYLGPVINRLSNVSDDYKELAESVDTTRHGIPIIDVKLSSPSDLEKSLMKTQSLLRDITLLSQSHFQNCSTAADSAKCLNQTVTDEINQFENAKSNLTELKFLSTKDSNLKLQLYTETNAT